MIINLKNDTLVIEDTHGTIDHKYRCQLVDAMFAVGSGDTEWDSVISFVKCAERSLESIKSQLIELGYKL